MRLELDHSDASDYTSASLVLPPTNPQHTLILISFLTCMETLLSYKVNTTNYNANDVMHENLVGLSSAINPKPISGHCLLRQKANLIPAKG